MKKRGIIFLWMTAVLLLFAVPVSAAGTGTGGDASNIYINPVYEKEDIRLPQRSGEELAPSEERVGDSTVPYYRTPQNAGVYLKNKMLTRTQMVRFRTYSSKSDWREVFQEVINAACAATDDTAPEAGDYLRWHFYSYVTSIPVSSIAEAAPQGGYYYNFHGVITYMSTANQEARLEARLNSVMSSLKISSMKSEYQIIQAIYCYVTRNVTYDYANLNNESYLGKYSAYNALCKGTAICQGYANLLYRMYREAGLSVRFIGGFSQGEPHAWNIVRMNGKYYNLDSTWDAGGRIETFRYFLRGGSASQFPDHYRDAEFRTAAFKERYPMWSSSFQGNQSADITYKLIYHLNGGKNHSENPAQYFGKTVTLKEPSRKGYQFEGWYRDSDYKEPIKRIEKTAARDYDLYAKWSKISVGKASIRALRFDPGGLRIYANAIDGVSGFQFAYSKSSGFELASRKYSSIGGGRSAKHIQVEDGKRRYYVKARAFCLDSAGEKVFGKWSDKATGFQVTYKLDGGVNSEDNPTYYRTCGIKLEEAKRNGYRFQGWYLDKGFRQKITSIKSTDEKKLVLYAKWSK